MPINRRTLLLAGGALLVFARHARAADDEDALFWTVTPPGRKGAIMFGYERIAAAITPDIVRDGDTLVDGCQRVVFDMPQAVHFGTVGLSGSQTKPILQTVTPQTADRLRKVIGATPFASGMDRMGGVVATSLLVMEGQHKADITVGGTIVDHARAAGKPLDLLVSEQEVQSMWRPPDMTAVNNSIGDDAIAHLLDLRDKVGPVGAYLEQLYRQRKGAEIVRVTTDMDRHGVFSLSRLMQTDQLRKLMLERTTALLTQQGTDDKRFMLFPLGILVGPSGMLASLKSAGFAVAPQA
jgi:hypothetical protein